MLVTYVQLTPLALMAYPNGDLLLQCTVLTRFAAIQYERRLARMGRK